MSPGPRFRRRTAVVAVACASALLLASCAEEEAPINTTEVEQSVGLPVDASRVTVLDAGDGERRLISYTDAAEDTASPENPQSVTLTVSDGFDQSVFAADRVDETAPEPVVSELDFLRMPLTAVTGEAGEVETEDGTVVADASREVTLVLGAPVYSDLDQAEDMQSIEGFELGIRSNDQGQPSTISFAAPVDATDSGRVIAEQYLLKYTSLPVIFPEEEIGVGAQWSVDNRVTGESTLLQTVTYTLTSLEGNFAEVDVEVHQRPSLGALEIESEGTGAETTEEQLRVLNSNTTSSGSLRVDLDRPLPTSGEVAWTTRVVYGGDGENRVVQDTTTGLRFSD